MSALRAPSHALKIFFSNRYCYAQIVSMEGRVVASASSLSKTTKARPRDQEGASSLSSFVVVVVVVVVVGIHFCPGFHERQSCSSRCGI
jgi:hypothetical protein